MTKIKESKYQHKGLNYWMLLALVIGNMIGSGIFLLPSALAPYGSISIISWVITSTGALLLALVFANLSQLLPKTGGPYTYAKAAFGDCIGFIIAYSHWIAVWVANAAVSVAFVGYLGIFIPALNERMAGLYNPLLAFAAKVGAIWLIASLNMLGIHRAGIAQMFMSFFKILPLVLISIIGLFKMHPHYLSQFNTSGQTNFSALTSVATLTLWAFLGLEAATVPAEAANNPRDIARGTITGVLLTATLYILSTIAIMGLIPAAQLKTSQAPYADAALLLFGGNASIIVALCAIISCLGTMNAQTISQGQIPFAAARDQLFPAIFAKCNRHGSPTAGLIISAALSSLLLLLTLKHDLVKQFTLIILLSTLGYLIPYFISSIASLVLLTHNPLQRNPRQVVKSASIACLAGGYTFWAIAGSGKSTVFYGSLLLFSAFPLYAWVKWQGTAKESKK